MKDKNTNERHTQRQKHTHKDRDVRDTITQKTTHISTHKQKRRPTSRLRPINTQRHRHRQQDTQRHKDTDNKTQTKMKDTHKD